MYDLVLFTHTDMDGYGCKLVTDIVMQVIGNNNWDTIPCSTNSDLDRIVVEWLKSFEDDFTLSNTVIIFSDICPSEYLLKDWLVPMMKDGKLKMVRIYDHHETNTFASMYIPEACIIPGADNQLNRPSGTSLLYQAMAEYLYRTGVSMNHINEKLFATVVDKIRLYDTYEWKTINDIDAKKMQLMFSMIGGDNFVRKYVNRIMEGGDNTDLFTDTELEFIDNKYNYTVDVIRKLSPDDFIAITARGYKVALMMKSVPASINDIADSFLEKFPEYDMVAQLSLFGNWSISFRSRKDDFDSALTFAEPMGGGGHKKASGAPVPAFIKRALTDVISGQLNGEDMSIQVVRVYNGG